MTTLYGPGGPGGTIYPHHELPDLWVDIGYRVYLGDSNSRPQQYDANVDALVSIKEMHTLVMDTVHLMHTLNDASEVMHS